MKESGFGENIEQEPKPLNMNSDPGQVLVAIGKLEGEDCIDFFNDDQKQKPPTNSQALLRAVKSRNVQSSENVVFQGKEGNIIFAPDGRVLIMGGDEEYRQRAKKLGFGVLEEDESGK